MRAAVTGATGFVGRRLVEALVREGAQVACLARSRTRAESLPPGCRIVDGDLSDRAALSSLCSGAEVVFHCAGLVMARNDAEFLRVNRDGTETLARAAQEARVSRLVFVSSLAATGPATAERPVDEGTAAHPVTPYGRSKLAAETALRAVGIPSVVVRPAAVYGPGDSAFLRIFRMARLGYAPVFGDGRQIVSLIHVDDLARGLLAAARAGDVSGRVYHAAAPETPTQRELVLAIGAAVGRPVRVLTVPTTLARLVLFVSGTAAALLGRPTQLASNRAGEYLAPAWTCSSLALQKDTGWQAQIPLDRGLQETAQWYRQAGWLS
jgi:dihydroflavonol-4-reductase